MSKVIIFTPLKCGSSTLSLILTRYYNYNDEVWEQDDTCLEKYNNNDNFILRGHTKLNYSLLQSKPFDIWFTIIRKPTDMYMSAYFQDISSKDYPYYFGDDSKVLEEPIQNLMDHFLQYEWNTINECSYQFNFNEIFKYTNINILETPFNIEKGYSIYQSPINQTKVVVLTIETLPKIKNILHELDIFTSHDFNVVKENNGDDKWYKNKYRDFKEIMHTSFFEKYKNDDNIILSHFYNIPSTNTI